MARLSRRRESERHQRDELLSAYLDDQLSAKERARLEARLASDPALRAELEDLRRTVALVRELPTAPLPRNFILPQTTPHKRVVRPTSPRRAWAAPLLTAASTVASVLFVVVLVGDVLFLRTGSLQLLRAPAYEAPLETEAPAAEPQPEAEKALSPNTAPSPMPLAPAAPVVAPTETRQAEAESEEGYNGRVIAGGEQGEEPSTRVPGPAPAGAEGAITPAPMPSLAPTEEAIVAPTAQPDTAAAGEGREELPPQDDAVTRPSDADEEGEALAAQREEHTFGASDLALVMPWWILEIALGLTAVGSGLAAVFAWRARRR